MIEVSIDDESTDFDCILDSWQRERRISNLPFHAWLEKMGVQHDNLGETIYFNSNSDLLAFKLKHC